MRISPSSSSSSSTLREFDGPRQTRNVHPEMRDVQSGDELLVFNADDDEDDDGDILIVRK